MALGHIIFVTKNGGAVVVESEEGFTVAELLGCEGDLERGDSVYGNWSANGGEKIRRGTELFDAYFQGCWRNAIAAVDAARRLSG